MAECLHDDTEVQSTKGGPSAASWFTLTVPAGAYETETCVDCGIEFIDKKSAPLMVARDHQLIAARWLEFKPILERFVRDATTGLAVHSVEACLTAVGEATSILSNKGRSMMEDLLGETNWPHFELVVAKIRELVDVHNAAVAPTI